MEKKKVIFIDKDDGTVWEYLILNESQLRLLKFLVDNDYFYNGYQYKVIEEEVNWKEI